LRHIVLVLGGLTLSLTLCRASWAEPATEPSAADLQVARRMFQQATADEQLGRWESALETLREIEAIKVTAGVLFHVAVCEQNLGRYVEALNDLGRAEELGQVNGDSSVLELIPDRRQAIEEMIGHVRLEFIGPSEGIQVLVDGQRISAAALRVDIPLDPKEHTIAVVQPGKPNVTRVVVVKSSTRQTELFDLTPAARPVASEPPAEPAAQPSHGDPNLAKKIVMYSAYGLALVGVGTGVYFVIDANNSDDAAGAARNDVATAINALENGGHAPFPLGAECSAPFPTAMGDPQPQLETARHDACISLSGAVDDRDRSQNLALWSFALGGVAAVGGTAVLLFWPDAKPQSALRITPTLGGAMISGSF
jgi:hypothetical protein